MPKSRSSTSGPASRPTSRSSSRASLGGPTNAPPAGPPTGPPAGPGGPEFSRIFDVLRLKAEGEKLSLSATAQECAALATRLGLMSLSTLQADLYLKPHSLTGRVHVRGQWSARYTQSCVVTLEPVVFTPSAVPCEGLFLSQAEFEAEQEYSGSGTGSGTAGDDAPDLEPIGPHGQVDVGEWIVQQLAAQLDPYPRKEGVAFETQSIGEAPHPLGELLSLKERMERKNKIEPKK